MRTLIPCLAVLALAGCRTIDDQALSNYDHVWDVCTDVVSSMMRLDEANKSESRIRGLISFKWERSRVEVSVTHDNGVADVAVTVFRETYRPYTTSAGEKVYEVWRPAGYDRALEKKILDQIRAELKRPPGA